MIHFGKVSGLCYGGDYNPEQWPEDVWGEDVRLMEEAGVNLVSLGVFSWAMLEPRPGEHAFGWLDRVLELLAMHGIRANLATATASPPPWLSHRHPETLPVTEDGRRLSPGARQHFCPSAPAYRDAAADLVRRLASRYGGHEALGAWHVNNEYGCHVPACYCDLCAERFRRWLQERYGTLEALNAAWGTAFWSQRYDDWDEVSPPRLAPHTRNPTQQLDYRRFGSDVLLECFTLERAILRELTPDVPASTNFMGFFKPLDYWRWAPQQDIVAHDSYPDPADPDAPVHAAMAYDLMRSLGGGKPWLLMEQATSQVSWRPHNALKRPGQMRLWSYQALARGAAGVMFFQWRASRSGAEKFHGAMVQHGGVGGRVWREVCALGSELRRLEATKWAASRAAAAIVLDWESWWALEQEAKPSRDLRLLDQIGTYYRPLHEANILVDFVPSDGDLTRYRLVLVPNLYLVRDGVAERLRRFVSAGGTIIMSPFSGIVDKHDRVFAGGYAAPFRDLLGVRVEEVDPYPPGRRSRFATTDGQTFGCDLWSDVLHLEGAEALGRYEDDFYAGLPAVTRNRFGEGTAYYVGTRPDRRFMASFLGQVATEAGIEPMGTASERVELVRRSTDAASYLYALNHGATEASVHLSGEASDLLTGTVHRDALRLPAYGVAVLEEAGGLQPARNTTRVQKG